MLEYVEIISWVLEVLKIIFWKLLNNLLHNCYGIGLLRVRSFFYECIISLGLKYLFKI
jgi:hypothetical protein